MSEHAIPIEPQDDPGETILAAIAHGMTGDPNTGIAMLKPFFDSPRHLVSLCAAFAETNALLAREQQPNADGYALLVLRDGQIADTRDMPAGERFAAQFTAAWLNGEQQTAYALFDALHGSHDDNDAVNVADGVAALYQLSVASMKTLTGRTP